MHINTLITVDDPEERFGQVVKPELAGKVKEAEIKLSHMDGVTTVTVTADDVTSMRTGITAIMNALRVFDEMSEVSSNGHATRD